MEIHPQAIVSSTAQLGSDIKIGPFSIIEDNAVIGDGCEIAARVTIKSGTTLGSGNVIHEGTILGDLAQHISPSATPGALVIGSNNTFRESVTIHRSMEAGTATTIGDNTFIMVGSHIAHDCVLGDHVIITNNVMLAGHVTIEDRAFLSGGSAAHQFCRIGKLAMVGGMAMCLKDVPPFVTIDGLTRSVVGLNKVGLRRAGYTVAEIKQLKEAYRIIYRSELNWTEILEILKAEFTTGPATEFSRFFQGGTRGFMPSRNVPNGATIKLRPDTLSEELHRKAG